MTNSTFRRLEEAGIERIEEIPRSFKLTPTQGHIRDVVISGRIWRSPDLADVLRYLEPPINYWDVESFNPGIPVYPENSPYQMLAFQWSFHHRENWSGDLAHSEFLAEGDVDPRREFAESFLGAVEQLPGLIAVWSSFEANIIKGLATKFPDLGDRLRVVLDRVVDLLPVARDHVYDPAFRGSYSLKSVVPAIGGVSYDDLDITDGGSASATFYQIVADPALSPEARDGLRRSLLAYCQRDTLALARVHQWLRS
jgi:hypothetical protein